MTLIMENLMIYFYMNTFEFFLGIEYLHISKLFENNLLYNEFEKITKKSQGNL